MTHRPLLALAAIAFVLSAQAAMAQEKIRVGICNSWPPYSMSILAEQNSLIDNYDLEFVNFQDPLGGHSAVAAGQVDLLECSAEYAPLAASRGTGVRIVAFTTPSFGVDHVVLGPKVTVETLAGKTFAVPEAFIGQLLVGVWLQQNGTNLSSVNFVNMLPDEAVGPMISGQVDAAYMYEPWVGKLLGELDGAQSVATTAEPELLETGIFMDVIYMNPDFVSKRREAALAFLRGRWDAAGWWHDNTTKANSAIAEYLGWGTADIDGIMGTNGKSLEGGVYTYDFDEAARVCGALEGEPPFGLPNGSIVDVVSRINKLWMDLGVMDSMVDPSDGVDCSLMADLLASGYRQHFEAR